MDAVILAAGKGNRLKPITEKIPKSLIKIGEETILEKILFSLPKANVGNVFIVTGHLSEKIETFIKKNKHKYEFNIKILKQRNLNGTYGAIVVAKKYLKDWFVVISGDDIHSKKDLSSFFEKGNKIGICKKESRYFEVLFDKNKKFLGFKRDSKKIKRYIATGCYTFNKSFFDLKANKTTENEFGIPQTIEKNIQKLKPMVVIEKNWDQLNTKEDLERIKNKYSLL